MSLYSRAKDLLNRPDLIYETTRTDELIWKIEELLYDIQREAFVQGHLHGCRAQMNLARMEPYDDVRQAWRTFREETERDQSGGLSR